MRFLRKFTSQAAGTFCHLWPTLMEGQPPARQVESKHSRQMVSALGGAFQQICELAERFVVLVPPNEMREQAADQGMDGS